MAGHHAWLALMRQRPEDAKLDAQLASSIMIMWPRLLITVCGLAFMLIAAAIPAPASAQALTQQAQQHIRSAADQVVAILARKNMTAAEQAEAMRGLVHRYFGVEDIAQWVVGRYWRSASEAERQEFMKLFEDFVLYSYAQQFSQYAGEHLQIQNATMVTDDTALVESIVVRPNAETNPRVTWRVTRANGGLEIRDVLVEGVSMAQTQRADFTATIQQRGGSLAGLNDAMSAKIAQLKADVEARR
jgi:phospholipid transport system substrate-binding protein